MEEEEAALVKYEHDVFQQKPLQVSKFCLPKLLKYSPRSP